MKARFALIWGFFILLVTITTSSPVFSLSLTSVDLKTWETTYQSDEVWDPTDWMGLTGAGNEDGYLPRGNGGKVICKASTMSLMQWWQFWRIAGSTSAHDTWHWTSVYQLSGDPGQRAGIELDYDLWSSYGLTAFDGYAGAKSVVNLHYRLEDELANTSGPSAADSHKQITYEENRYMIGLGFSDNTKAGTLDLGDFTVGDYLCLSGNVMSYVKTTHYYAGLLTAAMVTSFRYSLTLNELSPAPIPEPATLLLIGIGLIGLAACRRLVRNIKSSNDAAEKMMAA